ncbi:40S ribosomal protein SA [Plecturocebus cupreus]
MSGALDVLQMKEEDVLKFLAAGTHHSNCCRFTPGTFISQIQAVFWEPRVPVVTDPRADHQPLMEASYVNLPTIALCNTDSPLHYVDIAIPCNNKGAHSVGWMWWMLAQEVLHMRGTIFCEHPWEVMPDLYFHRDPEEIEKEEQAAAEKAVTKEEFRGEWMAPASEFTATQPEVADWSEGMQVPLCLSSSSPLKAGTLNLPRKTGLQLPLLRPLNE